MQLVIAYIATAVVFLAVDFLWLGYVAYGLYRAQLGSLLAEPFNMTAAVGFYLIYVIGILVFAVAPALKSGQWTDALLYGALFGFFCYATYDMTNLATLKDWPLTITLVDISWGTGLTALSATVGYLVASRFG
ncbi:MAG: DUF2177 family protein [Hyphomicrobiaceae bacterium]